MKKKLGTTIILVTWALLVISSIVPQHKHKDKSDKSKEEPTKAYLSEEPQEIHKESSKDTIIEEATTEVETETETTVSEYELALKNMNLELAAISHILDKKEWFIAYKNIREKYQDILDLPSVDGFCTSEELFLIQRCVETECYQQDFMSKANVVSVILNRTTLYNKSIGEVITKPHQFAYFRTKITEDTNLAVEYVILFGDTTDGCIAFRSDRKPSKWWDWSYQFTDESGHHFYK